MRGPLAIPKRCKNPPLCRVGRIPRYRTRAATGRNNYARYGDALRKYRRRPEGFTIAISLSS